jgi:hypothetical protein
VGWLGHGLRPEVLKLVVDQEQADESDDITFDNTATSHVCFHGQRVGASRLWDQAFEQE